MRHVPTATAIAAVASAFYNTHAGAKLFVCLVPQNTVLDAAGFAALTWVQVKGVGNHGETGSKTNILNYNTWDDDVIQKAKGMTDAGDPEIEVARIGTDAGQIIMRAAALAKVNNYAFKIELPDSPGGAGDTPSIRYNRGLVTGPRHPNGRNEDFDLEIYSLALNQREIVIEAIDVP